MKQFISQLGAHWGRMTLARRSALVGAALLIPLLLFALASFSQRTEWEPLPMRLDQRGMASIVQHLAGNGHEYRIEGNVVLVPRPDKFLIMANLYQSDIDLGETDGWDLLGDMSLSMSSKQLELIEKRILQKEMERTLKVFRFVRDAHIVLTPGDDSVFVSDRRRKRAKAAVTIVRRGSMRLGPAEVEAVVNVVSGGLPGLMREDVGVQDETGVPYHTFSAGDHEMPAAFSSQAAAGLELDQEMAAHYTATLQGQLDRVFPKGMTTAQVTVELDHEQSYVNSSRVDPDEVAAIKKSETRSDSERSRGGAAGVTSNIADGQDTNPSRPVLTNTEKTQEYRISEIKEKRLTYHPRLRRLRASVVADPKLASGTPGSEGLPEDLDVLRENLERIAQNALPFDRERDGVDAISVVLQRIHATPESSAPVAHNPAPWILDNYRELIELTAQGILVVLTVTLLFACLRGARKRARETRERVLKAHTPPPREPETSIERARRLAEDTLREHPEAAGRVLREWIESAARQKSGKTQPSKVSHARN